MKFDVSRFKRLNWAHSKRLLHGSLLCLSNDHFKTIIFAVVTDRDLGKLNDGIITVEVQKNTQILAHCRHKTEFIMIESSAYFEASRHILDSLQRAETDTMPFTQYLIANKWNSVALPHYLQQKQSALYDLSLLCNVTSESKECCTQPALQNQYSADSKESISSRTSNEIDSTVEFQTTENAVFNILDEETWSLEETLLDSSQLNALKMALTQEISLIQGPPGTGKTFIGIKIVQALLANKCQWEDDQKSPILVMCYTNHALDQFLEGIIEAVQARSKEPPKIIRVGGRSRSEKLESFKLALIRRKVFLPSDVRRSKMKDEEHLKAAINELIQKLHLYKQVSSSVEKDVFLTLDKIKVVISPSHLYQLLDSAERPEEEKKVLEIIWLGLWKSPEDINTYEQDEDPYFEEVDALNTEDVFDLDQTYEVDPDLDIASAKLLWPSGT